MTNEEKIKQMFGVKPDIYCKSGECKTCFKANKVICGYWLKQEYKNTKGE